MANDRYRALPAEKAIEWIAGVAAIGAIGGYVAWALWDLLFPDLELDAAKWVLMGSSLAGIAAVTWAIAASV